VTTFAATVPDFNQLLDTPKPIRRAAIDSMVEENRRATPISAVNDRAVKRLSISELNDLDIDEIRRRYNSTRVDTRGPVTRFLDLIDLPRNAIANVLSRSTGRRMEQEGNTAALGLGRVNYSDVLDDLGVSNRVVRGVVGFLGDVALDPLTYAGGLGGGLRLGKAVTMGRKGRSAFSAAIDAVKSGRTIEDKAIARYASAIGYGPEQLAERFAKGEAPKVADELATHFYGGIPTKRNKALAALLQDDLHVKGESSLAKHIASYTTDTMEAAAKEPIDAAQALYREYGRPYAKGLRIVKNPDAALGFDLTTARSVPHGTGVLHVPFTDLQVSVPAFTRGAQDAAVVAGLAKNSASAFRENSTIKTAMEMAVSKFDDIDEKIKDLTENPADYASSIEAGDIVGADNWRHKTAKDIIAGSDDLAYHGTSPEVSQQISENGLESGGITHDIGQLNAYVGKDGHVVVFRKSTLPKGIRDRLGKSGTVEQFVSGENLGDMVSGGDFSPGELVSSDKLFPEAVFTKDEFDRIQNAKASVSSGNAGKYLKALRKEAEDAYLDIAKTLQTAQVDPLADPASIMHAADVHAAYKARLDMLSNQTENMRDEYAQLKKLWGETVGPEGDVEKEVAGRVRVQKNLYDTQRDTHNQLIKSTEQAVRERVENAKMQHSVARDTLSRAVDRAELEHDNRIRSVQQELGIPNEHLADYGQLSHNVQRKLYELDKSAYDAEKAAHDARRAKAEAAINDFVQAEKQAHANYGQYTELPGAGVENVGPMRTITPTTFAEQLPEGPGVPFKKPPFDPLAARVKAIDQLGIDQNILKEFPKEPPRFDSAAIAEHRDFKRTKHLERRDAQIRRIKRNAGFGVDDVGPPAPPGNERLPTFNRNETRARLAQEMGVADTTFNPDAARAEALSKLGIDETAFTPFPEFDEAAQRERLTQDALDRYKAGTDESLARVASLTKDDIDRMAAEFDVMQKKRDAALHIAARSQTPITATLNSSDRAASNAARYALGLTDDFMGNTFLGTVASATSSMARGKGEWGEKVAQTMQDIAAYGRDKLGLSESGIKAFQRDYVKSLTLNQTEAFKTIAHDITTGIKQLGLSAQDSQAASRLLSALIFTGDRDPKLLAKTDQAGRDIVTAMQGGLLSRPEVAQTLNQLASNARRSLDQLREQYGIKHYFPNVLTPETSQRISSRLDNVRGVRPSQQVAGFGEKIPAVEAVERFQKPRSTTEYTFTLPDVTKNNPDGLQLRKEYKYSPHMDIYKAYSPEQVALYFDKDEQALVNQYKETVAAWESLTAEEKSAATVHELSPQEINYRVRENKMLQPLHGYKLSGDFFETDAALSLASRFGQEERNHYAKQFQQIMSQIALPDADSKLKSFDKKTGDYETVFGVKGKINMEGRRGPTLTVGGERFRKIKVDLPPDISPISGHNQDVPGIDQTLGAWYPEQIADLLEDTSGVLSDQGKVEGLAKAGEEIAKLWKVTTLTHTSWTINDVLGNLFLAVASGAPVGGVVKRLKDAMMFARAAAKNDRDTLSKMTFDLGGRTVTGIELLDSPVRQALGGHGAGEAISHVHGIAATPPRTNSTMDVLASLVKGDAQPLKDDAAQMIAAGRAKALQGEEPVGGFKGAVQKAKTGYQIGMNEGLIRRVWEPWARLNGVANDWIRTAVYMALLDDGNDAAAAASFVNRNLLDMSVLTSFDRKARRLVPFYNWIKASGVYGMRQLFENPKFFSMTPHVRDALETAFNGEANLEPQQRPTWLRDQQALQIGTDPDTRKALTLTSSLPTEAATYGTTFLFSPVLGGQALQDSLGYLLNSVTPIIKAPAEIAAGRSFYTKQTIGPEGRGDMTIPEYLANQVRPLRELGIGSIRQSPLGRAFDQGIGSGLARATIGGRIQPLDEERRVFQLQREADDIANALRKRINLAERDGNKDASLDARVKLLRHFENMQRNGLKIPVWAQGQVAAVQ